MPFALLAQLPDHVEAAHVGQVDVEQHQVGTQLRDRLEGLRSGVRLADRREPGHPVDVRAVDRRRHQVVASRADAAEQADDRAVRTVTAGP
jgi:hypothetical protein